MPSEEVPTSAMRPGQGRGRLVVEFIVIVAGVLVALAAESWWSERQARAYEDELRGDMLDEFEVNRSILKNDLAENAGVMRGVRDIVEMSPDVIERLSDSEVDEHLRPLVGSSYAGFDPAMGVARALVQSGDLAAIADRELRLLLAEWSARLDEKQRFTLNSTDFFLNHLNPRIAVLGSDRSWTAAERLEIQELLRLHLMLLETLVTNQERLLEVADHIVDHLGGADG